MSDNVLLVESIGSCTKKEWPNGKAIILFNTLTGTASHHQNVCTGKFYSSGTDTIALFPYESKQITNPKSGRATAPPSVCYSSLLSSASEEFTHSTAAASKNSSEQHTALISQAPLNSAYHFNNTIHQKTQSDYLSDYTPCSNALSYFSPAKADVTDHSFQSPSYSTDYFASSHIRSPSYSPVNNSFLFTNSNNSDIVNVTNSQSSSNFDFPSDSKVSCKAEEEFNIGEEELNFSCSEQLSSTTFSNSKISKLNLISSPKQIPNSSNILLNPTSQSTCSSQIKGTFDSCLEKDSKLKRNLEGTQKLLKNFKDDNFEELHRSETIIKNVQDANQELVTDSLLQLFHKKNSQDNLSYDLGDISPILVSLTNKYKSEEGSGLKKKESNEDFKLMNEFLTKIILEKEEKRFKTLDEKKKFVSKETFDDLSNELNERKAKRDAMSHYQEDKNHKKASNYGDYSQWDYFGQQDIQSSNSLNRRGHFSFGNTSQQHSVGWNQMGIGIPRQTNPYYTNPHSHMMPAHAHSDYRYNQWNNPNHKSIPNVHNAHSQNSGLPQTKVDIKHHAEISSSMQDFGRSIGSTSDFSKFRAASRDLAHRTPPPISEKSMRPDIVTSITPGIRNSTIRAPPMSSHPKTVINNPLSDLQMLVTNQKSESPPQKNDNFQQESVDLSAHSDVSKQKDNRENDASNVNNKEIEDFRTSVSVIQIQNKHTKSDFNESEKPVELTSKNSEKNSELGISPSPRGNNLDEKKLSSGHVTESAKEIIQNEEPKISRSPVKTSVIVGKNEEPPSNDTDIPKNAQNCENKEDENLDKKSKETEIEGKEKMTLAESSSVTEAVDVSDGKHEETVQCEDISEKVPENLLKGSGEKCDKTLESTENCKRRAEDEQPSPEKKKVLLEDETQLQKTFNCIEDENSDLPKVTSTSTDTKPNVNETVKKTPKKKPSRKSRTGRLSSGQSSGSERSLPCKKSKGVGNKEDSRKKIKKNLCDMMDRRGPFLHVMGSRESPASVTIVNFPKGDDEDEKDKSSAKKQIINSSRTKHQNELDYSGRSRNGLYCSTLSARYDAHTTDYSWICVFCKKGPHYNTMGDLFGPYIISEDENISLDNFSGDEKDISDAQKRGGRNKKSLRSNNMVEYFQKMSKKLRRTQSTGSCLTGMTVISDDQVNQLRYEVWVHEQCAVWSPNVFLIGSRLIGMQEAIWGSVKTVCSKCGISGANIGCVYRNCPNRSHYHCAKECGWSLQQETFISTCHIHKPRS